MKLVGVIKKAIKVKSQSRKQWTYDTECAQRMEVSGTKYI